MDDVMAEKQLAVPREQGAVHVEQRDAIWGIFREIHEDYLTADKRRCGKLSFPDNRMIRF
jgi:hypothetical protein